MEQKLPGFIEKAYDNLPALLEYADILLQSGKLPKHFYECDQYKNPLKNAEGKFIANAPLLVTIIQFGMDMGMNVSNSIRHLIPLSGTIALKGDGAKAMIFSSGTVIDWVETSGGSYSDGTMWHKISVVRNNGISLEVTFTADDAKRMGLWVSDASSEKHEYFKKSPWYKTPARMCMYRALGFISRDLFADILNGMYLAEEAADLEEDNTQYKNETGMTIKPAIEEKVSISNAKVVEGIKGKDEKLEKLLNPEVEPEGMTFDYYKKVKAMAPSSLVDEFRNCMPFTIEKWVECGGKKDARTIVPLLVANMENRLQEEVDKLGLNWDLLNG
jgi:hypothetical protein